MLKILQQGYYILTAGKRTGKEWVFNLMEEFSKGSSIHDKTGGSHVCILAREGKILYVSEDIGRHNAVDKAVGYALLNAIPLSECMLFTSGRVPTDMVEKVIAAGIPVLVSKSVPTKESVKLAHEYGLTKIENLLGSWMITYEKVDNGKVDDNTRSSGTASAQNTAEGSTVAVDNSAGETAR